MSETNDHTDTPDEVQIRLELDSSDRLIAYVEQVIPGQQLSKERIQTMLVEQGYGSLRIFESAIETLIKKLEALKPFKVILGEKTDANVKLTVSEDAMSVYADLYPAYGGEPITVENVAQALLDENIVEQCIDRAEIEKFLQHGQVEKYLIAKGVKAHKGRNGYLKWLVHSDDEQEEEPDPDAVIDFWASETYTVVDAGDPVLQRIPAEAGRNGHDLFGNVVEGKDGEDVQISRDWTGVEPSANDANLLVAKVKGHPVNLHPGVRVDPTLLFKGVNLATGHVEFDGSVEVVGDVAAGMKIDVTGDVHIKGVVERATIKAGNDITVTGGVLGEEPPEDDEEDSKYQPCILESAGNVCARFVNVSSIKAAGDIHIREYAFHCNLEAGGKILAGQKGGKGFLVGGEIIAGESVITNELGNDAYTHTVIKVGLTKQQREELARFRVERHETVKKAREWLEKMAPLKAKADQGELNEDELQQAKIIKRNIVSLRERIVELDRVIDRWSPLDHSEGFVQARKYFSNLEITINGISRLTQEEHGSVRLVCKGQGLVFE